MFISYVFFFFFNDTATTEIYTLSLHDALPIGPDLTSELGWLPCHMPPLPRADGSRQVAVRARGSRREDGGRPVGRRHGSWSSAGGIVRAGEWPTTSKEGTSMSGQDNKTVVRLYY